MDRDGRVHCALSVQNGTGTGVYYTPKGYKDDPDTAKWRKNEKNADLSVHSGRFAGHALDHHGDCHAGGEAMRVEDDVRHEAARRPGNVLTGPLLAADTLLTRTRGQLVAH